MRRSVDTSREATWGIRKHGPEGRPKFGRKWPPGVKVTIGIARRHGAVRLAGSGNCHLAVEAHGALFWPSDVRHAKDAQSADLDDISFCPAPVLAAESSFEVPT